MERCYKQSDKYNYYIKFVYMSKKLCLGVYYSYLFIIFREVSILRPRPYPSVATADWSWTRWTRNWGNVVWFWKAVNCKKCVNRSCRVMCVFLWQEMKKHGSDSQGSVTTADSAVTGFISLLRCCQGRWRMVRYRNSPH